MAGKKHTRDEFDRLKEAFSAKADLEIKDPAGARRRALNANDAQAWAHWFADRQKKLRSSGGRPSNPEWTVRRQVPFSEEVWNELVARSEARSKEGIQIAPAQIAAFLIEDCLDSARPDFYGEREWGSDSKSGYEIEDKDFVDWTLPELFGAKA